MCGIAGIIHKGKSTNVGGEMQKMLQSLKHRGPDSTGYALYGEGDSNNYILRFKVGENVKEGSSAIMEDASLYEKRRNEVNEKIVEAGGNIVKEEQITPYSFRYVTSFEGDLLEFARKIESVEMAEILSLGKSNSFFSIKKSAQTEFTGMLNSEVRCSIFLIPVLSKIGFGDNVSKIHSMQSNPILDAFSNSDFQVFFGKS